MPRKKGNHESWKWKYFRHYPYTVEYEKKFYHYRHQKYFENLKNNSHLVEPETDSNEPNFSRLDNTPLSNSNIHSTSTHLNSSHNSTDADSTDADSTTDVICTDADSTDVVSTDSDSTDSDNNSIFLFKTKEEADNNSKKFIDFLKHKSTQTDNAWEFFDTSDPNFGILLTQIRGSLGDLNFICLLLLIFAFVVYTRLPQNHIDDLLSLIVLVIPSNVVSDFPDNLYKFNQIFDKILKPNYRTIKYCASCYKVYENHNIQSQCHSSKSGIFVLFDLKSVLEFKFKSKQFCKDLLSGILSSRKSQDSLSSITYGRVIQAYRKHLNVLYPLSSISFSLFIDGVNSFKSSKTTIVPSKKS